MSEWIDRIYCGDCLQVLKGLPEECIDSVVTSPPYAMQRGNLYGGIPEKEYPDWTVAWMGEVMRVLKPTGSVLINIREHVKNGQISDYVHLTRLALRAAGWTECDELIWIKPSAPPVGNPKRPRRSWERILWFGKDSQPWCDAKANGRVSSHVGAVGTGDSFNQWLAGKGDLKRGIARCRDYIEVGASANARGIRHPATFPPYLATWMIRLVTPPGGVVLDPFIGSGTTAVAALEEGFHFVGVDNKPEYVELARKRTGKRSMNT